MSGVSDGSLAAHTIALQHVEGMVSVRVVPRLQELPGQIGLLIKGAQQLPLFLGSRQLGHLQKNEEIMKEMGNCRFRDRLQSYWRTKLSVFPVERRTHSFASPSSDCPS